ncbi:MAG: rhodanese-like domain-containing protein [Desulfobacteraceae bacterium]|nr:rhodanese-like domain-containing protein [Desulfobacteraceae bacterium]
MKKNLAAILTIILTVWGTTAFAGEMSLESYISNFDYKARKDMKITSETLVNGLEEGTIQLIDIRFKEEVAAWRMGFARNIPLNELPARLDELDKDKIIVTACPHKDRAGLAMAYLRTKGYNSKYLVDGLLGLAEFLRGDTARNFMEILEENQGE